MSPYLILGFLISGLLHVYVPKTLYSRFLHRKGWSSVVGAAILGVPLPLCSCGVIPTAMTLKKEGASDGATVAFLVGTPQTGVDSILATYSLLGLPFAIIRPVAAFFIAIFSGVMIDKYGESSKSKKVDYSTLRVVSPSSQPNQSDSFTSSKCSCGCSHSVDELDSQPKTLLRALRYGYVDMMVDFGTWLFVGLFIAAAITVFIPDALFALFKEYYLLNLLLILLISIPMYICATGSIPIALSLIMKGVSPGAAFVLLMAGPATNIASLIILRKGIGGRKITIYLLSIIVGAIACALLIDFILPQDWFSGFVSIDDCGLALHEHEHGHDHTHDHNHDLCTHGPIWWQTTTSIILVVLFANSLIQKWLSSRVRR